MPIFKILITKLWCHLVGMIQGLKPGNESHHLYDVLFSLTLTGSQPQLRAWWIYGDILWMNKTAPWEIESCELTWQGDKKEGCLLELIKCKLTLSNWHRDNFSYTPADFSKGSQSSNIFLCIGSYLFESSRKVHSF